MDDKLDPKVLEKVDEAKRSSLRKIIIGSAFAIPVIASFTMSGLGVTEAYAGVTQNTTKGLKKCQPPREIRDPDRHGHNKIKCKGKGPIID